VSVGSVLLTHVIRRALEDGMGEFRLLRGGAAYKDRFATDDPGIETYGLARGVSARAALGAALAVRGRSLGLRRLLDRS
jgi:CelD/BcsL family acetyltransferase involved in cellulose biosynthesis